MRAVPGYILLRLSRNRAITYVPPRPAPFPRPERIPCLSRRQGRSADDRGTHRYEPRNHRGAPARDRGGRAGAALRAAHRCWAALKLARDYQSVRDAGARGGWPWHRSGRSGAAWHVHGLDALAAAAPVHRRSRQAVPGGARGPAIAAEIRLRTEGLGRCSAGFVPAAGANLLAGRRRAAHHLAHRDYPAAGRRRRVRLQSRHLPHAGHGQRRHDHALAADARRRGASPAMGRAGARYARGRGHRRRSGHDPRGSHARARRRQRACPCRHPGRQAARACALPHHPAACAGQRADRARRHRLAHRNRDGRPFRRPHRLLQSGRAVPRFPPETHAHPRARACT